MQAFDHAAAKREVGRALLEGCSWREAVRAAGVQMSRATAYRLRQRMLARREDVMSERRQGHLSKVCSAVRTWLEAYYQQHLHAQQKYPRFMGPVQAHWLRLEDPLSPMLRERCFVDAMPDHTLLCEHASPSLSKHDGSLLIAARSA